MNAMVSTTHQGSLDTLQNAVMAEVKQEAEEILEAARSRAEEYRTSVAESAQQDAASLLSQARKQAVRTREQAEAQARLDAQHQLLQRRERLLDTVFDTAAQRLDDIVQSAAYAQLAYRLAHDAAGRIAGSSQKVLLRADAATEKVLAPILGKLGEDVGVPVEMGESLPDGHGILAQTADGHRRYDNRLETRLARLKDELRAPVYHILNGEDAGE